VIKEALQYLLGLGTAEQHEIGKQILTDKPLHLVKDPTPSTLVVRNLSGLVDYVVSDYDNVWPFLIHVAGPKEVHVLTNFNRDKQREVLLTAEAIPPGIPFGKFQDIESMIIMLQSNFVPNEHRELILRIIGNLKEENVANYGDDGVSQAVTARTGITTVENIKVPNPVILKPYRTFIDIAQPESQFIFRMQSGPAGALFEADGGEWKLQAIREIRKYLDEKLAEQIVNTKVTIIS
jgi:hypothetical protein